MVGLNYNRWIVSWSFSFFTLLSTHHIGFAKTEKEKKVATVSPTTQNKSTDTDATDKASKAKLKSELEAENALERARIEQLHLKKELIRLNKEIKELLLLGNEIEDEKERQAHTKAMRLLNMKKERLTIELELAKVRFMKQMEQCDAQLIKLSKTIELEKGQTQLLQEKSHRLQAEMEALQAKAARDKHIHRKPIYLKDPLIKRSNTLVLSDRCIDLNGCITLWKANYIVDQIHYFNNKNSEWPIFLIIGNSPGGSAWAGWNILQAIEYSKAPVYVVVKTFAASMAALITTLATKSYAYPNAIILHHQPLSGVWGNVRETKEHYEHLNEVWKRLGGRVAKKMGISLKAFEQKLYEKSIYGDWREYGNHAQKLKWVDCVISGIKNSAVSSLPNSADYTFEKYLTEYYGFDTTKQKEQSEEAHYYHALAPHDFDYSYRPDKKAQMIDKR
ncbi:proteolytic subunit ClpP [Cardinium endosymbiont of Sogatella furcifera]|uniref:ATP-dependent Clp protease proteolytic subunit n=1 Tax=Cardinium endosymbiont of Sogatella furcifera TaxID=650378 RepID=UPI000E0D9138|nr:ATP-dependent Clp protease proteolytic subunit [Cardinium endosymbiont of Sogatella furcifera]AXI24330.1 proteolytic subunit ClpP [Cardinium endosymbiont of Sogatella furcifera]